MGNYEENLKISKDCLYYNLYEALKIISDQNFSLKLNIFHVPCDINT